MLQGITLEQNVQTVQTVMNFFSASKYNYYLTGSKYFDSGNAGMSDWDFFVEIGAKVELERLGFKSISSEAMIDLGYDQSQFSAILELKTQDGIIQVQLVQGIFAKVIVQDLIRSKYLTQFNSMSKKERRDLWSLLLITYGRGAGLS
jgi:hypothetical protein